MDDTTKKVVIGGVIVLLAVGAYLLYDEFRDDTEDRPPIVVNESSLSISAITDGAVKARPWKRDGQSEKWKMDHKHGRPATGFAVTGSSCTASGSELFVQYASGATKYEFRFYLDPHPGRNKNEPAVDSPVALASDNSPADRKTIRYPGAGDIIGVRVGTATVCTFPPGQQVELRVQTQY